MWKRILGVITMILAGIGLLISVGVVVLVWLVGYGGISGAVKSVSSDVQGWLSATNQQLDNISTSLTQISTNVQEADTRARALVQANSSDRAGLDGLVDKVESSLGPAYVALRRSYVAVRERGSTISDTLHMVDRLIPVIDIPQFSGDRLQALSERLDQLDERLMEIRSNLADRLQPVRDIAQRVATGLTGVVALLADVTQRAQEFSSQVQDMQARVTEAESTVLGWVMFGSVGLTFLALWQVLLHTSLFIHGLAWFRSARPKVEVAPADVVFRTTSAGQPATGSSSPPAPQSGNDGRVAANDVPAVVEEEPTKGSGE